MVAETFSMCDDPLCDANQPDERREEALGKPCEISQKCVAACAAYGRVCPCYARAAGRAACQAMEKLAKDSAFFKPKPDFVTLDCDDIIIKEKLGEGGFSYVNVCVVKTGNSVGQELAVKYLKRQVMVDKTNFEHGAADLAVEARFLDALSHEHIVKLHGITAGSVETNVASGKECGFFIVIDRLYDTLERRIESWHEESLAMGGNLLSRFSSDHKDKKKRALTERLKVAYDIADTMNYLHSRGIIYRDLKPDNVGFDKNGTVKMFDFGLARELKPSAGLADGRYNLTGHTGSRRYMAPEVAKDIPYDQSVDVFSFGILLWEMCAAEKPFLGYSSAKHMKNVVHGGERPKMDSSHTAHWPLHLQWLIKRCWSAAPAQRPTFEMVKQTLSEMIEPVEVDRARATSGVKPPVGGFAGMKMAPRMGRAQTVAAPTQTTPSVPPSEQGFASITTPPCNKRGTTIGGSTIFAKGPFTHNVEHQPN